MVGEMRGDAITVADVGTLAVKERIPFDAGVRPFAATTDGQTLYAQVSNFEGYIVYDRKLGTVTRRVELPKTAKSRAYHGTFPKDAAHHGISLFPGDKELCIAATASDYAALVASDGDRTEAIIPVGAGPSWTVTSPDGTVCFVSSREANTVSVLSRAEKKEIKRIAVGNYPQRMILARLAGTCHAVSR